MGINPFSIIIKVSEIPFYPRTSGASSEPSFFANMIFYFAVLYYGIINKNKYLFGLIFGYIFLSTLSLTLFIYLIFVFISFFVFKITFRGKLFTPSLVIFSVPILMIIFERFIYHFAGFSLPYWFYYNAESWRELSLYSSIYGSQLIGPFSGGSAWPSLMAMDKNILQWMKILESG